MAKKIWNTLEAVVSGLILLGLGTWMVLFVSNALIPGCYT